MEENDMERATISPMAQNIGKYNQNTSPTKDVVVRWKPHSTTTSISTPEEQSETILLFCASVDERDQFQRTHPGSRDSKELLLLTHQQSHTKHAPTLSFHNIW
eukprot:CAMPEP_0170063946 /NCGR_PEP_ID=MMETSP0019_2-20121128/4623_1 /TAXON_ID=98059 /ORGANISM="Dinobryon sp., Strain UTEXLB2267" /LENGTH=102 /DNA_ID=CAMNT_0010270503 /DNA_START=712 /DNA_END=1017 /DNA_ORIENTATION=-